MGFVTVEPPASRVVVVEGIYALSSKLRDLLDLRVSIKGGVHFDLVKRVLRDIDRSGQQPEAILQQISSTVYPMYKARAPKVEGVLRCNRSIFLQVTSLMTVDGLRSVRVGGAVNAICSSLPRTPHARLLLHRHLGFPRKSSHTKVRTPMVRLVAAWISDYRCMVRTDSVHVRWVLCTYRDMAYWGMTSTHWSGCHVN